MGWAAPEVGLWTRLTAELEDKVDKASMRLVCKSLDVAASLAVTQLPAHLRFQNKQLHPKDGRVFELGSQGSTRTCEMNNY